MNSTEIVDLFRTEMNDKVAPYLWGDTELYAYLDDAQTKFVRFTDGIADARTADVCNLSVVPGTAWYNTHESILNIRSATRADTGREVELLTAEQARTRGVVFAADITGPVRYVVTGLEPKAVRISPMPNETVTIELSVYRLPLVTITDAGDQALEIDAQYHTSLLMWMKHRAYEKPDAETFDRRKSEDFEQKFMAYCAKAKEEAARARRVHGNVLYGGL